MWGKTAHSSEFAVFDEILLLLLYYYLKYLNVWLLTIVQMKEKSQRPTHQSQVYNILQPESDARRRLAVMDNFFHLVKIVIHPRLVRHRGREMVNLRREGHVQHVSIQSTRQQVAGIIILQCRPIVQFVTWNSPDRPWWNRNIFNL